LLNLSILASQNYNNMTQFRQIFYSFLFISSVFITGCSVKTNMMNNQYTVSPNPLEVKGDSVQITMSGTVPAKSMNPKANVQFQPYLKTAKGDIPLKAITIGGEAVTENVDFKLNSKTGGKITYSDKIPYNPDMKRATLYPAFAVKVGTEYKTMEMPKVKGAPTGPKVLAEGTITTALMVKNNDPAAMDGTPYVATVESKSVNIYFPIDKDKFNPNFKMAKLFDNKKQIEQLKGLLKMGQSWTVKGISINAYASPDGELSRNENLAKGREESSFNYFKKELRKLGYSEANDSNLSRGYSLSEDWAGYAKAIEASNHPDKAAVLAIINSGVSNDEKEARIKKDFRKFYDATKNTLLPPLRRSELVVKGQLPLKSDEELKAIMAAGNSAQLNEVEMLHLAAITSDNAGKQSIYNAMIAKYPNDWRGYNGLASTYMATEDYNNALTNLEKANSLSPENGTLLANMGVIYRTKGDYTKAEQSFKSASGKGTDVNYNMGVLAIKRGNYADAVTSFKKTNVKDFNVALAELLNNNLDGCNAVIDNMSPESKDWKTYYLRAISGARAANSDVAATNLTRAVQMNGDVRNMAKEDVEFIKLWENPAFQSAIK
jgi:tetratricopeptide (TPR) repeat protein